MMIKYLTGALLFLTISITAQDFEFGKVSLDEVQQTVYAKDSLADAVYLHKSRETYFNHEHPDGWIIITDVYQRIKILSKDGLDYATVKINLYKSSKNEERVTKIKGFTYNAENGKLDSKKLKKNGVFNTEINEYWDETSITMPNVKVGSVIEIKYQIISPFWKIDDLIVQEEIPTAHYFAKIRTVDYFKFKRKVKGNFIASPKDYSGGRNVTVSYEQNTNSSLTQATKTGVINVTEFINEYEYKDVEALIEEPYVDNIENYRYSINYELASVKFPSSGLKKYSTTWEEVVKTIFDSKYFGDQLSKTRFFKDDLALLKSNSKGQTELMNTVFDFVKNKMTWNEQNSKYSRDGLQKVYKANSGNSGDINLLLVSMLKEVGLDAYPVLLSTRAHGIPAFPTIEGLNYVIAAVKINNEYNYLDATEKLSTPNVLPQRVLNWNAMIVRENGTSKKVLLYPKTISNRSTLMSITLNEDGSIVGKSRTNYTLLEALTFRKKNEDIPLNQKMESLTNSFKLSDVTDLTFSNFDNLNKPVMQTFSFELEEGADVIGNDIYFSPLFFMKMDKNPFTLEVRNYPINYVYPYNHKKIVSIKIPEGYKVSSIPDPISISLPDAMGSFILNISETNGSISVMSSFTMNQSIIPTFNYSILKEFYNQRLLKENEKVVLTKI